MQWMRIGLTELNLLSILFEIYVKHFNKPVNILMTDRRMK